MRKCEERQNKAEQERKHVKVWQKEEIKGIQVIRNEIPSASQTIFCFQLVCALLRHLDV